MKKQQIFGQFEDAILIEDGWARACDWCSGTGKVELSLEPWNDDLSECWECCGKGHKMLDANDIEDMSVSMMERIEELTKGK